MELRDLPPTTGAEPPPSHPPNLLYPCPDEVKMFSNTEHHKRHQVRNEITANNKYHISLPYHITATYHICTPTPHISVYNNQKRKQHKKRNFYLHIHLTPRKRLTIYKPPPSNIVIHSPCNDLQSNHLPLNICNGFPSPVVSVSTPASFTVQTLVKACDMTLYIRFLGMRPTSLHIGGKIQVTSGHLTAFYHNASLLIMSGQCALKLFLDKN